MNPTNEERVFIIKRAINLFEKSDNSTIKDCVIDAYFEWWAANDYLNDLVAEVRKCS